MNIDRFRTEMQRMARTNGVRLTRENHLIEVLELTEDESFVNVFNSDPTRKRDLLIVTSVGTYCLYRGVLGPKLRWTVPHRSLDDVRPARAAIANGYVTDSVLLESGGDLFAFQTGFNDSSYPSAVMREIAADNAQTAAEEIAGAARRSPPAGDGARNYFSH